MSTTPTDPAPTPMQPAQPAAPAPVPTPPPADPAPAQEPDWKAEARKWEARSKENSAAAARLAEIEEASKTEAQKQADALSAAEAKVKEYEVREQVAAWKDEVSKETGVPAAALAGATKEEIEAHAETLKALIAQPTAPPAVVPTIGRTPATPANIPLSEQIATAEAAGNKALVSELKAMQLGAISQ